MANLDTTSNGSQGTAGYNATTGKYGIQPVGIKTTDPNTNVTNPPNFTTQPAKPTINPAPKSTDSGTRGFSAATLALQKQLNATNAGKTGYVPLKLDGIMGPKTQGAQSFGGGGTPSPDVNTPVPPPQPTYDQNHNGLYGQMVADLANRSTQSGKDYQEAQAKADTINQQMEDAKKQFAKQTSDINQSGTWTSRALGEQGQANIQNSAVLSALGSQYQGAQNQVQQANTQQGLLQQALQSAMAGSQPQFQSYTSAQFDPVTGKYKTVGGGQYGSGPGAAANISSIGDAQKGINGIIQSAPAINNQFSAISNYASQAKLSSNSPLLSGIQQAVAHNIISSAALTGFQGAISSLNQLLQEQGEAPIDPATATQLTLQQAQQTVKSNLARKQSSYQDFINRFNSGGGGGSSGGSVTGANPWH